MVNTRTTDADTPKPDGGVDYRTVKAWFQQCRDLAAAIEVQKQKIQRIRDVAEKCTQSLSPAYAGQMWSTDESNGDAWPWLRYGTSFLTCRVYNMHKKTQRDFGRGQLFSSL